MLLNVTKLVFGLTLFALFGGMVLSSSLFAKSRMQNSKVCSKEWGEYVEVVSEALETEDLKTEYGRYFILFSGPDGEIYNCLEGILPPSRVMESVVFWSRARAKVITETRGVNTSLAVNECNLGIGLSNDPLILTVNLPYSMEKITLPSCATRLSTLREKIIYELNKRNF